MGGGKEAIICACQSRSKAAWVRVCAATVLGAQQSRNHHQHNHINDHLSGERQLEGSHREQILIFTATFWTQLLTWGTWQPEVEHLKNIIMAYERILAIENLSDVPNPWKGFTMNRCIVVALVILLVSSSVHEVHEAVDYFVEETGIRSFIGSLQDGSIFQISLWDSFMWWWGSEEVGAIRKRKKPMGGKVVLKPKAKE